uniref:Nucleotide exchange factor SIL1 n=1 Tax=Latimeria chalumnae TaxID=7897 RepID=H3AMA3_LATCH
SFGVCLPLNRWKKLNLALLLFCTLCLYFCLSKDSAKQKQSALTLVEENNSNTQNEEATVEDELDPADSEVFYPTNKWKPIKPGQAIPAGLHVRVNLQTGENEAKLPDNEEGFTCKRQGMVNTDSKSFTAQELKRALKKFKEETITEAWEEEKVEKREPKQKFRPLEELKKEFEELNMLIETDFQIITKLVNKLNGSSSTLDEKIAALYDLEFYVHQIDNAQDLVSLGGLQLVINALNNTEDVLKEHAAFVLGSALSSNPKVQIEAMEAGALQKLIILLATEQSLTVKKKALYAVSSMLRHFPYAQQHFLRLGGLQALGQLFQIKRTESLCVRAMTLLYDLLMEKILLQNIEEPNEQMREKIRQYNQVNLLPAMLEQDWCILISKLLLLPEHDTREKVLKTMNITMASCREKYEKAHGLNITLSTLKSEYEELAAAEEREGEKDGYFKELLNFINRTIQELS